MNRARKEETIPRRLSGGAGNFFAAKILAHLAASVVLRDHGVAIVRAA
jgi:hypothetical protein